MSEKLPDIQGQKMIICGLQGSGKTHYVKELLKHHKYKTLVYAPHEYDFKDMPDAVMLVIPNDYYGDIEKFMQIAGELARKGEIDGVVIDEFDMLYKSTASLGRHATDIMLNHRHYPEGKGMFVVGLTRRPQDVPTKIYESSKFITVFAMQGANAKKKFNDIFNKMGDQVLELNHKTHEFIIREVGEIPQKFDAI